MTGFGFAEFQDADLSISVDLKSYNHRYLDVVVSLPPLLSQLEPRVRELIASRCERGRVECYIRAAELEEDLRVAVDKRAAIAYHEALVGVIEELGLEDRVGLGHLIRMEGVVKTERRWDVERFWNVMRGPLSEALDRWDETRSGEGEKTRGDILGLVGRVEDCVATIDARRDEVAEHVRREVQRRFEEVLGDAVEEQRVLTETAALLVRFDINEEVVRLRAHLGSFRDVASASDAIGKRLDFVAQELGREINTIGSKSVNLEISTAVIEAKDCLEKIREQLRNVE
jgi:uncharacterized protein (TIGR00255 family)